MLGKSFKQIMDDAHFKKSFNQLIAGGSSNEDAISQSLLAYGNSVKDISPELIKAAKAADQTGVKMRVLGDTSKLAAAGMKILASAANMAFAAFASWAIGKIVEGINNAIHAQERLEEKLTDAKSKYQENASAVEDIERQLKGVQEEITNISKDPLTITTQEQLDLLKQQEVSLLAQYEVAKAMKQISLGEQAEAARSSISGYNSGAGAGTLADNLGTRNAFLANADAFKHLFDRPYEDIMGITEISAEKLTEANIISYRVLAEELSKVEKELNQAAIDNDADAIQNLQSQKAIISESIKDVKSQLAAAQTYYSGALSGLMRFDNAEAGSAEEFVNKQFDLLDQLNLYVIESTGENVLEAQFDQVKKQYSEEFKSLEAYIKENGSIDEAVFAQMFSGIATAFEKYNWKLPDVVAQVNATYAPATTSYAPSPTSYDQVTASAWRATEAYTALTEAMEAQNEAGYLSAEAYNALIEADAEYIELLELTAEGYKINEEALWKYIEAQDDLEKGKAIKAMMELQDAMLKTEDVQEKMAYQSQIDNLSAYINQLDRATGALARFRAAQETPNQDEEFGEGQKAFDVIKEGRKTGKVGTDDFKESVGLMLGDNWETEYAGQLDKAYKKAEQIGKRYFGQKDERQGMANFRDDLVKANLGEFDGKTFTLFEGVTLEETAKQLGTSVDAVRSMFGLMQAYGGDFEFPFVLSNEDIKNMEAYVKTLDKAELAASETQLQTSLDEQKQELASLEDPVQIQIKQDDIAQTEQALSLVQDRIDELDSGEETDLSSLSFVELVDYAKKLEDAITTMNELGIEIPASITGDVELLEGLIELKGLSEREAKIRIESGTPIDKVAEGTTVDGVDESSLTNAIRNTGKAAIQNENGSYNYANPMEYIGNIISQIESANRPVDFETVFAKYTADQKAGLVEIDESFLTVGQLISAALEKRNEKESESVEVSMDTNIEEVKDEFGKVEIDVSVTDSSIEGIVSEVDEQLMGESVGVEVTPEVTTIPESEINTEGTIDINGDVTSAEATLNEFELEAAKEIAKKMGLDPTNAETALASLEAKLKKSVTKTVYVNTVGEANASGTDSAAGGMSLVDERGAELIEHTSRGTYELGTNSGPRFTNLDPGDVVHTASETKKIMSRMAKVGGFFRDGLNKGKAIIGKAFATGVSGSMSWDLINQVFSSSSGSSKKNSSSSKSSTKTKNWKTYVEKLFDWIEIRLDRLQTQTDKWILAASEAIGYVAKNSELDKALSSTSRQINETTQAYQRYLEQAQTIASKAKLSAGIVKSIQEGTIDIASYDKTTQEKIKAYQEWWKYATLHGDMYEKIYLIAGKPLEPC